MHCLFYQCEQAPYDLINIVAWVSLVSQHFPLQSVFSISAQLPTACNYRFSRPNSISSTVASSGKWKRLQCEQIRLVRFVFVLETKGLGIPDFLDLRKKSLSVS